MSKLIYALSKVGLEIAYGPQHPTAPKAMTDPTNVIYKSVTFTEDGYLYTHGKYFRIFPNAATLFSSTTANGTATLKDSNNTTIGTIDVGVTNITTSGIIAGTLASGAISITHGASTLSATTLGALADAGVATTTIKIPKIVTDLYGHLVSGTSEFTATLDRVTVAANNTNNAEYKVLLGSTSDASELIQLAKASTLKFNPSTGALTASKFIGTLNYNISITLNGAAPSLFDNTADKSFTFYAPVASGTTGTGTYLTPTTGGAPVWQSADTIPTSGSTKLITSGGAYTAINSAVATANAMVYQGTIDASPTGGGFPLANKGDTFKVSVAGTFNGTKNVEVGDMVICNTDGTAAVPYASITAGTWNSWDAIQVNVETSAIGFNLAKMSSISAISFIRINADNTVTPQTAANFKTDLSLNNVENTALSTWVGSANITTLGTIATGTWNATAISAVKGGTGQTAYVLGDLLYASSTTTLAKLAGNITAGKQYLSQTGTGSVSAAPVWASISGADVTGAALTKTDDTNVTLTLGGTPATALLRAASITVGWTGTLATGRGGTGINTYAAGDILYASAANVLSRLAKGVDGQTLKLSGGVPTWGTDNDTHWTSSLVVGESASAIANAVATNSNVWLNLVENGSIRNAHNIVGSGSTTVVADASGKITIDSLNSWRDVLLYTVASPATALTINGASLQFGEEFFWSGSEVKLGWAEVSAAGAVTYAY